MVEQTATGGGQGSQGVSLRKKLLAAAAATVVLGWAGTAGSSPVLLQVEFTGNDCAGVFGNPFSSCDVGNALNPAQAVSPIVAKYDVEATSPWEINSTLFPSVTGIEFTIAASTTPGTGWWSYTPGPGDPVIKYWVAKGGPGFNLMWMVPAAAVTSGGNCFRSAYTLACLQEALPVTSGDYAYATPVKNQQGERYGLSHLSFYDSRGVPVPEPASMLLLGAGLLGLASRVRRRR